MSGDQHQGGEPYFAFSASLRIVGVGTRHDDISRELGEPSVMLRRGEPLKRNPYRNAPEDIWILNSPLGENSSLSDHLRWLRQRLESKIQYVQGLVKDGARVDLFCGYRSSCDHAGFALDPDAAQFVADIGVRLEISVIVA